MDGKNVTNAILTNEQEVGNLIARMRHAVDNYRCDPMLKRVVETEMNVLEHKLFAGHFSPFSQR